LVIVKAATASLAPFLVVPAIPLDRSAVQVMFDALLPSIEHIKSSKFRTLGVTSATRSELLPDVPTVADSVPGYEEPMIRPRQPKESAS
jgi:tripartite-type tricarboxylate transporter receptor subunit TctC